MRCSVRTRRPRRSSGSRPTTAWIAGSWGSYGCYVGHIVRGDLGESYRSKRPVATILVERLWPTVQLALAAILFS